MQSVRRKIHSPKQLLRCGLVGRTADLASLDPPWGTHQQAGQVPQEGDVGHHELAGRQEQPGVGAGRDRDCPKQAADVWVMGSGALKATARWGSSARGTGISRPDPCLQAIPNTLHAPTQMHQPVGGNVRNLCVDHDETKQHARETQNALKGRLRPTTAGPGRCKEDGLLAAAK